MLSELFKTIWEHARLEMTAASDGRTLYTKQMFNAPEPLKSPLPVTFTVRTLSGIVDYLKENPDVLVRAVLHVATPTVVSLFSPIFGPHRQRECWVTAKYEQESFGFGSYMDVETFIIALQTRFVATDTRDGLIRLVSNVKAEAVGQALDDGFSQTIVSRKATALATSVKIENPIPLIPFRTFSEIAQPVSPFILRARGGGDEKLPYFSLSEADGGAWQREVINSIVEYFRRELDGIETEPVIIG